MILDEQFKKEIDLYQQDSNNKENIHEGKKSQLVTK